MYLYCLRYPVNCKTAFLGGLYIINPCIRLMCMTSVSVSLRQHFGFQTFNSKDASADQFDILQGGRKAPGIGCN